MMAEGDDLSDADMGRALERFKMQFPSLLTDFELQDPVDLTPPKLRSMLQRHVHRRVSSHKNAQTFRHTRSHIRSCRC